MSKKKGKSTSQGRRPGRPKKTLDNYLKEVLEKYPKIKLTRQQIKRIAEKAYEAELAKTEKKDT